MMRTTFFLAFLICNVCLFAQVPVARDTITVFENGRVLKMPWANGINHANISSADLNQDGKKDIVVFDRINQFGRGRFRCFIKTGNAGEEKYVADPDLSYYFPALAYWAVMLDYDGDGKEDIFCSTSGGIRVYKNTSTAVKLNFTLVKSLLLSDYNPAGAPNINNLYTSSVGLPGISDVDNDGDLDILTFAPLGVFIELHRNMSVETYGHNDSLVYEIQTDCWGGISESSCKVNFDQCNGSKASLPALQLSDNAALHAGACLTCLDSDGDTDKDLVIGDVECNTVHYVHNTGGTLLADFTDTTKLYPNFPAKNNNNTYIKLDYFPCTYLADVDGDSKPDLLATPNAFGTENYRSIWYYRNTSLTNTVSFQLVKKNLFQDEMIEVGQNAFPALIDYNADGKKDLLIGNYGYFDNKVLNPRLTLYENVGTASTPQYSLISRDYGGLSGQSINHAMPAVGDIDNDGDVDICIGTSSGQIHWLENTAGAGNVCNFSVFKNNPFSFTTISAAAAPQLFDLDADGKLDLLIGMKNGNVAFYRNTGSPGLPAFSLVTNTLGGINVKGSPTQYAFDGYATPYFYNDGGSVKAMVGSVTGQIFHYSVGALTDPFTLLTSSLNDYNEGGQSTVLFDDINGDQKRDLIIGNASGGLSFFSSASPYVGLSEQSRVSAVSLAVFPNPGSGEMTVKISGETVSSAKLIVRDLPGRALREFQIKGAAGTIHLHGLATGVYFLECQISGEAGESVVIKKIILE